MKNKIEILLVEDNPAEAVLFSRALKKNLPSSTLFHVKDGEDAIDFLFGKGKFANRPNKAVPKLIVLDLKMPRMDGHDVLRVIKVDEKTKSIPVVMMSTSNDENDVRTSYTLGANSYIVKPSYYETIDSSAKEIGNYWLKLNKTVDK